jgi:hypothetical protein
VHLFSKRSIIPVVVPIYHNQPPRQPNTSPPPPLAAILFLLYNIVSTTLYFPIILFLAVTSSFPILALFFSPKPIHMKDIPQNYFKILDITVMTQMIPDIKSLLSKGIALTPHQTLKSSEATQSKADAEAMKKQSENLTMEYDRLLIEHQKLQVSIKTS